jgi:DNA primase
VAIPEEEVAAVRAATDLVGLVGERTALKRQGRRWVGLCPFHAEKTPSFSVNAEEGLYYCFGCQASGDAISFVRATEGLDFVGALERLAERAGMVLTRQEPGADRERLRRRALQQAMEAAVAWYHERLLTAPDAGPARDYLRSRGYDGEVVRRFRLGWAPDEWDALARALKLAPEVASEAGLGFVNRAGRLQDHMRARVIFPIFDPSGRAVALGGRALPGWRPAALRGPEPKYKNSPETPLYSKRRTLYGLNWAKAAVVETGEVVVCEGYTDVIAFFMAGVPRAVATCGTALAEEHFQVLSGFARRVVLAYDADAAGQAAAGRLYEWERRHELDVAVAELPAGSDPAELGARDPAALAAAVEGARPYLEFRLRRQLASADLASAEGRARAAEACLAVVAEHPSELVRDQYLMVVADRCRIDPGRLRPLLARQKAGRKAGAARARPERTPAPAPGRGTELEALRLAIQRPEEVADLLEEVLFEEPLNRDAFAALAGAQTLHEALEASDPQVADLLRRLAVEEAGADALDVVRMLALRAGSAALADLEAQARAVGSEEAFSELAPLTTWLRLTLEGLREGEPDREALERLVAWLRGRQAAETSEEGA